MKPYDQKRSSLNKTLKKGFSGRYQPVIQSPNWTDGWKVKKRHTVHPLQ